MTGGTRAGLVAALGCWAALSGCGGERGTLTVKIKTPPGADDPFLQAVQVRMTVGDRTAVAPVMAGRFSVKIEVDGPDREQPVRLALEALDAGGQVVGRGRTPNFVLLPQHSEITVFVGRPGRVVPTEVHLLDAEQRPAGRADLAGASLRGRTVGMERALGALLVGGVNASGTGEPGAWLYDPMTHALVAAGRPQKARRGAVLVPSADGDRGQQAILWGGAVASGGQEGELPTAAEVFDPAMPSLAAVFSPPASEVAEAGPPGAVGAAVAEVQPGLFVATGGRQGKASPQQADQPLNQAVLLQRFAAPEGAGDRRARPGVQRLGSGPQGPMVAARYGHTATPVSLPEGPGLLLFGGLPEGVQEPAAEEFSLPRREFRAVPLVLEEGGMRVPSRRGHVAAPLRDGRVLVLGGVVAGQSQPEDSGLLIDVRSRRVQLLPGRLAVARQGAAATVLGDEIAVCGGLGPQGQVLASCEFFGVEGGQRSREAVPMPTARAGHLQLALETDQVLLVGGVGEGGQLPSLIDLLTPLS